MTFPTELREYAARSMHISRFQLASRSVIASGGRQLGSVGQVTFSAHGYDRYWMSMIYTLAHYAFYAGAGAKTTMGLGQCRLVE